MDVLWPKVVDHLVDLFADALPGMDVFDGPPLKEHNGAADFVAVGWIGDDESGQVEHARSSVGNEFLDETGQVQCLIVAQAGGTRLAAQRARAFATLGVLTGALAEDQDLGGLLEIGTVSTTTTVLSAQNGRGSAVSLALFVNYTALA